MSEKPEHNPISDEAKYFIELSLIKAAYHVERELQRHGHVRYYQNVRASGVRSFSKLVKSIRELTSAAYTPNEEHRAIHPFSLVAEIGLLTGSMIMRKALTPEQQTRFIETQQESLKALKLFTPKNTSTFAR